MRLAADACAVAVAVALRCMLQMLQIRQLSCLLGAPAPSISSSCEGIINIDQNVNVLSIPQIDRALCEMQYRAALNR